MKRKRKRTEEELDQLAWRFSDRMEFLEQAWGCKIEHEVDLSTGETWLKITMPSSETAMVIRCDVEGITLPGRGND